MRKSVKKAIGWATVLEGGRVFMYHLWEDGTVTRRPAEGNGFDAAVQEVELPVRGRVIGHGGGWPKGAFAADEAHGAVEALRRAVKGKTWSEL